MMIDWNGKITRFVSASVTQTRNFINENQLKEKNFFLWQFIHSNTLLGTYSNVTVGYMDEDNQYNYQFFQTIKGSFDLNLKQFIAK